MDAHLSKGHIMNEVFLLGAGFSRAIHPAMPLLPDLTKEVSRRITVPAEARALGDNVELWLSYLAISQPWLSQSENLRNRATSLDMSRVIAETVEECTNECLKGSCPGWLLKLLRYWHESRAHVITLNYDVLIERASADIQDRPASSERLTDAQIYAVSLTPAGARAGAMVGSEPRDTFRLYKLHGSTNWYYSGRTSFYGETIVYVPTTNWLMDSNLRKIEDGHRRHVLDKVPLIIPPLFDKVPYYEHESIRSLWTQARTALRYAPGVYIIGYSLPATDAAIQMFLKTSVLVPHIRLDHEFGAIKTGKPMNITKLRIINTDSSCASHYAGIFQDAHWEIEDSYVGEDAIPRLVDDLWLRKE